MRMHKFMTGLYVAAGLALLMAGAPMAHAQGCALCYTQAASAGARIIQALRSGILVLVVPPAFLSVGITVMAYRKRNQFVNPDDKEHDKDPDDSERGW
jgi:hypothetical protein